MYGPPAQFMNAIEEEEKQKKKMEEEKEKALETEEKVSEDAQEEEQQSNEQETRQSSEPYSPLSGVEDVERVQLIAAIALRREQLHLRARLDSNEFVHSSRAELEQHYRYYDEQLKDTGCRQLVDSKSCEQLDLFLERKVHSLERF
jgi:hypothetical protein